MPTRTLLAVAILASFAMGAPAPHRAKPRKHVVTIEQMRFQPQSLDVAPGDTIVWVNKDLVPHTATSKDAVFDSKLIAANASWKYTVRKRGTLPYTCTYHSTMTGTIRVR
jgi:plastocyanin